MNTHSVESVLSVVSRAVVCCGLLSVCLALSGCVPADESVEEPSAAEPGTPVEDAAEAAPDRLPAQDADAQSLSKARRLLELPDGCNTPDGMTLLADGSFLLSMPNFNEPEAGARLLRITKDNQAETFLELPKHPVTKENVGPLGICSLPSGDLLLADYQATGDRQSRVLRITMKDGKPGEIKPVVTGFHVSNAVIVRGDYVYVSETQIDVERHPGTSGVMRFALSELEGDPVVLAADEPSDPHCLGIIEIQNKELPLGADGLCFDKQGNLYCGNFTDGTVHQFQFDADGKVVSNKIFAQSEAMKSADGLFFDPQRDVIYVADSKANAVQMVHLDGRVETLAQNGDTDGADGGMDQPCEVLVRGNQLIVSNMDWPVPGCINQQYNPYCSLSVIDLAP